MRAQYRNVGWQVAQNYIMGTMGKDGVVNGFNIYKVISESESPGALLSKMTDMTVPLETSKIMANMDEVNVDKDGVYQNYLHFFIYHKFWEEG